MKLDINHPNPQRPNDLGESTLKNATPSLQTFLDKYGVKLDNAIMAEEAHLPVLKDLKVLPEFIQPALSLGPEIRKLETE